jgi:hypothetical protein
LRFETARTCGRSRSSLKTPRWPALVVAVLLARTPCKSGNLLTSAPASGMYGTCAILLVALSPLNMIAIPSARRMVAYESHMLAETMTTSPVVYIFWRCLPSTELASPAIKCYQLDVPPSSRSTECGETCKTEECPKNGAACTVVVPIRPICSGFALFASENT